MNSLLLEKSMDFATQIVLFYEEFSKSKKDTTIAKQLLRSATSVGANINEAVYGNRKADFVSKLHISLKETDVKPYAKKIQPCGYRTERKNNQRLLYSSALL